MRAFLQNAAGQARWGRAPPPAGLTASEKTYRPGSRGGAALRRAHRERCPARAHFAVVCSLSELMSQRMRLVLVLVLVLCLAGSAHAPGGGRGTWPRLGPAAAGSASSAAFVAMGSLAAAAVVGAAAQRQHASKRSQTLPPGRSG